MKATLTLEFDSLGDMHEMMQCLRDVGYPLSRQVVPVPFIPVPTPVKPFSPHENVVAVATGDVSTPAKPPRKPRNDAGKPRGPYKAKDNEGAGGDLQATTASPAGQAAVPMPLSQSAAPAEPVSAPQAPAGAASVAAPAAADPSVEPTQDDAKAALRRINDTKGMGTPACIAHLQQFGVNQLSLLPKESYALFIKQADEKIAEFLAGQKK